MGTSMHQRITQLVHGSGPNHLLRDGFCLHHRRPSPTRCTVVKKKTGDPNAQCNRDDKQKSTQAQDPVKGQVDGSSIACN
mmetsp:Transcript_25003/g.48849  ORF Transcript_25003/g.48849 Transcript_25003/m.48849 type:complete len:80 (-) Transcript_25003:2023-2262(-)